MILQSSLSFPTYWYGYNRGMSNEDMSKQGKATQTCSSREKPEKTWVCQFKDGILGITCRRPDS